MDKMNSRKFLIALVGMVANALLAWKGSIEVKVAMTNIFYFGFGFMFCEAGVDAFAALGKSGKVSGLVDKVLSLVNEVKTLKKSLKKDDDQDEEE
jgi:hypothetical protein